MYSRAPPYSSRMNAQNIQYYIDERKRQFDSYTASVQHLIKMIHMYQDKIDEQQQIIRDQEKKIINQKAFLTFEQMVHAQQQQYQYQYTQQ